MALVEARKSCNEFPFCFLSFLPVKRGTNSSLSSFLNEAINGTGFKVLNEGDIISFDTEERAKGIVAVNVNLLQPNPNPPRRRAPRVCNIPLPACFHAISPRTRKLTPFCPDSVNAICPLHSNPRRMMVSSKKLKQYTKFMYPVLAMSIVPREGHAMVEGKKNRLLCSAAFAGYVIGVLVQSTWDDGAARAGTWNHGVKRELRLAGSEDDGDHLGILGFLFGDGL